MLLIEDTTVELGGCRLLDGADLVVRRGEHVGLLAADPAVVGVLIELLTGRRRPDRGRVRIDGLDPVRDARFLRGRVEVLRVDGVPTPTEPVPPTGPADGAPAPDVWVLDLSTGRIPAGAARVLARPGRPHGTVPVTVLLTTDRQHLATALCDRVAVITDGRIVPCPSTATAAPDAATTTPDPLTTEGALP